MKNILLFLTTITGLFFFFLAPLRRYVDGKIASEAATKARNIERSLNECEKWVSSNSDEGTKQSGKGKSGKKYFSSLNPKFIECLHEAVYNTAP